MTSNDRSERLDLARDLPTTDADTQALRRAKGLGHLDLEAYLRFLGQLPPRTAEELRAKRGPCGDRPFTLA